MMQASVSHECRQPLSSLIYQLWNVQKLLKIGVKLNKNMQATYKSIVEAHPDVEGKCTNAFK